VNFNSQLNTDQDKSIFNSDQSINGLCKIYLKRARRLRPTGGERTRSPYIKYERNTNSGGELDVFGAKEPFTKAVEPRLPDTPAINPSLEKPL